MKEVEIRLRDCGNVTSLNSREAYHLFGLLKRVYEPDNKLTYQLGGGKKIIQIKIDGEEE